MSVAADGGEEVDGKVAADVVSGLVEGADGVFNPVDKPGDVCRGEFAMRVIVGRMTRSLSNREYLAKIVYGDQETCRQGWHG